jgi:uncharacterized membrane protein YoaK (UPF0700 family)
VGIALGSVIFKFLERTHSPQAASVLYLVQAALLAIFLITGCLAMPVKDVDAGIVLICGIIGTMGMGVQNARGKLLQTAGLPNTVMTGNVTQVVLDVIELIHRGTHGSHGEQVRSRLGRTLAAMGGFALGAIAGALVYKQVAFFAIALPVAVLLLLAWKTWRA